MNDHKREGKCKMKIRKKKSGRRNQEERIRNKE
jgi:hypothetical protein